MQVRHHEVPKATLLTADDLLAMGDQAKLHELVDGVLIERPMSSFQASCIAANIASELWTVVHARQLGNVAGADGTFILKRDPDTVRTADASFVRADRLPPRSEWDHFLALAPDLVVEVVSPDDHADVLMGKVLEYLDVGVRLVWVIHPEERMVMVFTGERSTAHLLYEGDTLDGSDVLPNFSIPVADLFL